MMDYKEIYMGIMGTVQTLIGNTFFKIMGSLFLMVFWHQHAILFYCFSFLVFFDCFTKWMSISYSRLKERGDKTDVWAVVRGIKMARSDGLISSEVMKHRFVGKILVYLFCASISGIVDLCMIELQKPVWAISTVISYLVVTELLSIIENLNDSGIEIMKGLAQMIERKGK